MVADGEFGGGSGYRAGRSKTNLDRSEVMDDDQLTIDVDKFMSVDDVDKEYYRRVLGVKK